MPVAELEGRNGTRYPTIDRGKCLGMKGAARDCCADHSLHGNQSPQDRFPLRVEPVKESLKWFHYPAHLSVCARVHFRERGVVEQPVEVVLVRAENQKIHDPINVSEVKMLLGRLTLG